MSNEEHQNILPNLILPFPSTPTSSSVLNTDFSDCEEETLEKLSDIFNVKHLSKCRNAKSFEHPITGVIWGSGNRFVIPLKVRSLGKIRQHIVYFVVDSGAPFTMLSNNTAERIYGDGGFASAIVQGRHVMCFRSKTYNESLKNLNLLSSQFLSRNVSIIISPHKFKHSSGEIGIFYLTPFSMIDQVRRKINSYQQDPQNFDLPDAFGKLLNIDSKHVEKEKTKKALSRVEKPNESQPPNLLVPFPWGPIYPGASNTTYEDCEENGLTWRSNLFKIEHLSECTNDKIFEYPIIGVVTNTCYRFVIALKVRSVSNPKNFVVYFIVDSGAPVTSFSKNTADKIFGNGDNKEVIIQDVQVNCRLSESYDGSMINVNLLGSDFFLKSNTSIISSPNNLECSPKDDGIFYLTPFSMIDQVRRMVNSGQQNQSITQKLEAHSVDNFSTSDSKHAQKEEIKKGLLLNEKPDESQPSTSFTTDSHTNIPMDLS